MCIYYTIISIYNIAVLLNRSQCTSIGTSMYKNVFVKEDGGILHQPPQALTVQLLCPNSRKNYFPSRKTQYNMNQNNISVSFRFKEQSLYFITKQEAFLFKKQLKLKKNYFSLEKISLFTELPSFHHAFYEVYFLKRISCFNLKYDRFLKKKETTRVDEDKSHRHFYKNNNDLY